MHRWYYFGQTTQPYAHLKQYLENRSKQSCYLGPKLAYSLANSSFPCSLNYTALEKKNHQIMPKTNQVDNNKETNVKEWLFNFPIKIQNRKKNPNLFRSQFSYASNHLVLDFPYSFSFKFSKVEKCWYFKSVFLNLLGKCSYVISLSLSFSSDLYCFQANSCCFDVKLDWSVFCLNWSKFISLSMPVDCISDHLISAVDLICVRILEGRYVVCIQTIGANSRLVVHIAQLSNASFGSNSWSN